MEPHIQVFVKVGDLSRYVSYFSGRKPWHPRVGEKIAMLDVFYEITDVVYDFIEGTIVVYAEHPGQKQVNG